METLLQDIRYGFRMLLKKPSFTAAAVLSLGLGIGACTAIFSVVDAVLLRSLPYPKPERIVQLREISSKGTEMRVANPNFQDVRARSHSFESVAQYTNEMEMTVTGGSEPARSRVVVVSGDFFRVFGVQPLIGRAFLPEESKAGSGAVAVVSYGFWQRLLGGKIDFTGMALNIDNQSFTVVGVMPPGFDFPQRAEIWIPIEAFPPDTSTRTAHNWSVVGRLRSGVSLEAARADISTVAKQLKQEYGKDIDAVDMALVPLHEDLVRNVRRALLLIAGAVGLLLLIACANVANLLFARVVERGKELAVRTALGATRFRLARQFITESVLLTLIAAALGLLLSLWGVDLLVGLNEYLPRVREISVDWRALVFTVGLALLTAIILGLVPALRSAGADLQENLKEASRGQSSTAVSSRLRGLLVISQVALTLVLLIGAGLLGKSFVELLRVDPGFRPESVVAMDVSFPSPENVSLASPQNEQQQRLRRFHQQLLERLDQLPGVIAAGEVDSLPLTQQGADGTFLIDNNPTNTGYAEYRQASAGYFAALGIPLLRGRLFEPSDHPDSPHVAVISQSLARKYFPDEDPIGKRIQFGNMDGDERLLNIIGVVGDVHERLDRDVSPTVYVYSLQRPLDSNFSFVVRANTDTSALVSEMRRELQALDHELPANFRTLEQVFSASLDSRRFSLILFGVFASVALLLAITGIYGVMSYSVTQRTHEMGIRIALGARSSDVLKLIVGHGMALTLLGIVVGLAGAFAVTRLMASLLYGVSATDPLVFAGISLLLMAVALAACFIPARRATKVDPIIALRHE